MVATMPERYARVGDLTAGIDEHSYDLAQLLEWADRDEREGLDEPPADEA